MTPTTTETVPADLHDFAALAAARLRDHFPAGSAGVRQVLTLAEEAGEFAGAYRRHAGLARRTGPWSDVAAELADVNITAHVTAHVLALDVEAVTSITVLGIQGTGRCPAEPGEQHRQVLALQAQAGTFLDAYIRHGAGQDAARALAGVIAAAHVTAAVLGIDLEAALANAHRILTRGWRDTTGTGRCRDE